jgi:hypothetical protein
MRNGQRDFYLKKEKKWVKNFLLIKKGKKGDTHDNLPSPKDDEIKQKFLRGGTESVGQWVSGSVGQ